MSKQFRPVIYAFLCNLSDHKLFCMYECYECSRFIGLQSTDLYWRRLRKDKFRSSIQLPLHIVFGIFRFYFSILALGLHFSYIFIYLFLYFQNRRKLLMVYLICEIFCIFVNTTLALSILGTTISDAIYSLDYNHIFYSFWVDVGLVTSFFVTFIGKYFIF